MENSGGLCSGPGPATAYYCNSYPLTTAPPHLASGADRGGPMVVSSGYSEFKKTQLDTNTVRF